jgi:glycosyltransferase involved in cell wall biosynthesis
MQTVKVSILIPCYNASAFITDTLKSCLSQDYSSYEIIIADDGSTDDSSQKISQIKNERVSYFYQQNQGVSAARNSALEKARGEYVIFFDADDLMSEGFISARVAELDANPNISFVSGHVINFTERGNVPGDFRGVSENALSEILFYQPLVTTCPSNYMFRRKFIEDHKIRFNTSLSSTADRLFLIQCIRAGRCSVIKEKGKLLYRISASSMSHGITARLAADNEAYYSTLIRLDLIPSAIKKPALHTGYFILSGTFYKTGNLKKAFLYGLKAFFLRPAAFIQKLVNNRQVAATK